MRPLLALLLIAGCSKGGKGEARDDRVASCNIEEMKSCVEYRGTNLAMGSDGLAKLCNVVVKSAVFAMTPCPTANIIGSCARNEGKDIYYTGYDPAFGDIEKRCAEQGGKYSK